MVLVQLAPSSITGFAKLRRYLWEQLDLGRLDAGDQWQLIKDLLTGRERQDSQKLPRRDPLGRCHIIWLKCGQGPRELRDARQPSQYNDRNRSAELLTRSLAEPEPARLPDFRAGGRLLLA